MPKMWLQEEYRCETCGRCRHFDLAEPPPLYMSRKCPHCAVPAHPRRLQVWQRLRMQLEVLDNLPIGSWQPSPSRRSFVWERSPDAAAVAAEANRRRQGLPA